MKHITLPYLTTTILGTIVILSGSMAGADELNIKVNANTYVPFSSGLTAGTAIFLNADNNPAVDEVRAMQRSLGYREVDYKAIFSTTLAWSSLAPANITTAAGITTYDYSGQSSTSADLVGFWTSKDLPIVIGPDGKAYTTDGHHTTAGYLASNPAAPRTVLPGMEHVVVGHVVANFYNPAAPAAPDDAFWLARQSENRAFLFGPNGSPLAQPGDPGYGAATQPILPSTLAMPVAPGKAGMTLDNYRSLAWGLADGIVKSAATSAGAKIVGFKKTNPATPGVDTNFVEFYWADFQRDRVVWDDTKSGTALGSGQPDANLVKAPLSFFAAVANGIALGKSEAYRDRFGRSIADYDNTAYAGNTQSWAHATIVNGLAKAGETYNMYLLDDSTVQGDITPSALSTNRLHINTTTGQTIAGVMKNFSAVTINGGGSLTTSWKDAALNTAAFNSTLTIAPGTGTVTFTGVNTYTGITTVAGGTLALAGAGSIGSSSRIVINSGATFDVSGTGSTFVLGAAQTLVNNGSETGVLAGAGTIEGGGIFNGGVTLQNGARVSPGNSPGTLTFAAGLALEDGVIFNFELGPVSDLARISGGTLEGSSIGGTTFNFTFGPGFVPGSTVTLLDWTGAARSDVNASDFVFGNVTSASSALFSIQGNTLVATVIPEPGSLALLGISLGAIARRRTRPRSDAARNK